MLALRRFVASTVFRVSDTLRCSNCTLCERKRVRKRKREEGKKVGVHVPLAQHVRHRKSLSGQARLSHSCSSCFRPHWVLMDAVSGVWGLKEMLGEPPVYYHSTVHLLVLFMLLHSHPVTRDTRLSGGQCGKILIHTKELHIDKTKEARRVRIQTWASKQKQTSEFL